MDSKTLDRLEREREGDRGVIARHMEYLAAQNPFDRALQWAAAALRRALEKERGHGD